MIRCLLIVAILVSFSAFAKPGSAKPPPPPTKSPPPAAPAKPAPSDAPALFTLIETPATTAQDVTNFLKTHKVYLADQNSGQQSLLLVALIMKKMDVFHELYGYFGNPDPNYYNPANDSNHQATIYDAAIALGDWATIVDLRQRGGDLKKMPGSEGLIELMAAVNTNSLDVVQHMLAEGQDPLAKDKNGTTVLMYASQGTFPIFQLIMSRRPDVLAVDNNDKSALLYAGCDPGIIHALIQAGSDLKKVSLDRSTALQRIAGCDDDQDFAQAYTAMPDANFQDPNGFSLVSIAAQFDSLKVLKLLLANHANFNLANRVGITPLMLSARYGKNPEVLKTLIEAGADLHAQSHAYLENQTALMYAAGYNSNSEFTRMLAVAGSDLNFQEHNMGDDSLGWTPLMVAALDGFEDNIAVLVKAGADINVTTRVGLRAYDYAVGAKMSEATLKLLK